MKDETPETEIAQEEVAALIEGAFRVRTHTLSSMARVPTNNGEAVQFNVWCKAMGDVTCLYPLEPLARKLIQRHNNRAVASSILAQYLNYLPIGLEIGLKNASTATAVVILEAFETNGTVNKEKRAGALKKMSRRNTALVPQPKSGVAAEVTLMQIAKAAGRRGEPTEQITANHIAMELGCSESAVYKALKKEGVSLGTFLNILSELKNQML
jgi:hypothetical protein